MQSLQSVHWAVMVSFDQLANEYAMTFCTFHTFCLPSTQCVHAGKPHSAKQWLLQVS